MSGISHSVMESLESIPAHEIDLRGARIDPILQQVVAGLPWHFSVPIRGIAWITALACLIMTGRTLPSLSSVGRGRLIRLFRLLPAFGMVEKLARSLTLMHCFDDPAPAAAGNNPPPQFAAHR